MGFRILINALGWPLAALACISPAFADTPQEAPVEDSPSMLRSYTWEGSFDRAGDANRAAELELRQGNTIQCAPHMFQTGKATQEQIAQQMANCQKAQKEAEGFAQEVGGIRQTQRVFADVSRVSDIAAVGAVGATAYAQLGMRDTSQADSLKSAANVQETAGYVSYATGATDFSMGAYAYMMQKRRLEQMQEILSGSQGGTADGKSSAAVAQLAAAAEQTKQAAYSHMLYGAGKAAFGYASMWMAKENRKQADSLSSINVSAYYPPTAPINGQQAAANAPLNLDYSGAAPYYGNAGPQISEATDAATAGSKNGSGGGYVGASGGASVMPMGAAASGLGGGRSPSSSGGGGLGSSGTSAGSGGSASAGGEPELAAEAEEDKTKTDALQSFEIGLGSGGGGMRYAGGARTGEDGNPVAALLTSLASGGEGPKSSATGVHPKNLYKDALEGLDGSEAQGSMAGVTGGGGTLFEVVKTKYNKMMEVGRLQGPGAIEVRN